MQEALILAFPRDFNNPLLVYSTKQILRSFMAHYNLIFAKASKESRMQPNNFYDYPFSQFYNFQQYSPYIPYFEPLFDFNSSYPTYQITQPQQVQNISDAFGDSCNLQNALPSDQKPQIKPKKQKNTTSVPQNFKEKLQTNSEKNLKNPKSQSIEQKQGRNANSNLLRMFFRRLQNMIQDNPQHIQYIIKKLQMKISLQQFIQWIQTNKIDHRNYIRVPSIKKFFIEQHFVRQHTKIMRILFKDFIDSESINCYLTSRKLGKHFMAYNFHSIRSIFKDILVKKV